MFNEEYITYDKTVEYRSVGASKAAKLGAVAVLIRTIGPFSIASPHTGEVDYEEKVPKIPAACIATEYAEMLQRLYDRGRGDFMRHFAISFLNDKILTSNPSTLYLSFSFQL